MVSNDDDAGIEAVASTLSEKYVKTEALAIIAAVNNKPQFAEYLRNKFPKKLIFRSGDIGEILATSYLEEECGYTVGPSRLAHRDHQEWAMRGDDVIGAKFDASAQVQLAKGEAKSRRKAYNKVVVEAREGLEREQGLPSGHSLTQFAERLVGTPDQALGVAIIDLLSNAAVRPDIVRHLMFLFTTNDPIKHVSKDLNAYTGPIEQLTVTLQVRDHKRFINSTYEMAPNHGP
ncbi:Hachiman antiphage defense system protein HamA [Rhodococcus globerulus]|uniref:Hachiman antiphage defense system protein HamA n=1 Tax=Rhodococcus globerulus TaxID=33008 RepID=A0ABU4C5P8_RHOGO|nr:Hachiman antiphage defense system protein HamA [Rhodococcus globerulus]MDV6271828.1 Hachiman antiphage defense system protein HamA [Rhodococcus globerulus]